MTIEFNQPVLEKLDSRYDYYEERIIALGEVKGRILFLVYTWRDETRRIISARRATKREQNQYYQAIYG